MSTPATTLLGMRVHVAVESVTVGAPASPRFYQFDGVIRAVAFHETNVRTVAAYIVEDDDHQLILVSNNARVTVLPEQLPGAT